MRKRRPTRGDHLVLHPDTGLLCCFHCGQSYPYERILPAPITFMPLILREWRRIHKNCQPSQAGDDLLAHCEHVYKTKSARHVEEI